MFSTMTVPCLAAATRSPTSSSTSHRSPNASTAAARVKVYRHEPYAASLITPATTADSAVVSCHARYSKPPTAPPTSPARSVSDAGLSCGTPSEEAAAAVTPTAPSMACPSGLLAAQKPVWVAFKYGRKPFVAPFPLRAGAAVVVEGDRGVDLGVVLDTCLMQDGPRPQTILRVATAADEARHAERIVKELEAVRTMRTLAAEVDCPAHVEDVMFQLDDKKITVIISRSSRAFVDFRRLQRALFDVYRCRIWFSYLDEIQETMSTDVTQPLRRGQRRRASPTEVGTKKVRHLTVSATSSAENWA